MPESGAVSREPVVVHEADIAQCLFVDLDVSAFKVLYFLLVSEQGEELRSIGRCEEGPRIAKTALCQI